MKKQFMLGLLLLGAIAGQAKAQEIGPNSYKIREIQYDLQGNSMVPRLSDFPGPGVKCIRLLDGDRKTITGSGGGPSCAVLGSSFTVDSNYVINVPVTTGPQGVPGQAGTQGIQGIQGVAGAPGKDGVDGAPGATGPAGTTTWSGITGRPTTLAGFGITDAVSSASLTSTLANYATASSLASYATTSALSSGLSQKYNQPTGATSQYIRGDGSLATLDAYPASANPAGYLTTITASQINSALGAAPVSQAGARASISLTTTGTGAATYNSTTGVLNVPTPAASAARIKTGITKAIGTCFQLSATRDAWVTYNVEIASTMNLLGGQKGSLYLETFTDSACTTGTDEVMHSTSGNTAGLNVTLVNTVTQTLNVNGYIMAGLYAKIRTTNDSGTPVFTAQKGQEVLQ